MPERELERLRSVNRFLKLEVSKDAELERIVQQAAEITGSPIAMITFMTEELQHVKYRFGTDLTSLTYDRSFCKEAVRQDDLFIVENASTDPYFSLNRFVANEPNIRFYAGVPLTTSEGDKVGTVCVYDDKVKGLNNLQKRMLKSLAKQVMYLLEFDASLQLLKQEFVSSRTTAITLRSFFDASSSCHLLLDREMRVVAFNKALNEITFAAQGKYLKEGERIINMVHPQFKDDYLKAFERALEGEIIHIEKELTYSLGRICWYMTFEPAYGGEGNITGVSFNAVNITSRVEQEELVREQMAALQMIREVEVSELKVPGTEVIRLSAVAQADPIFSASEEGNLLVVAVQELQDKMSRF